MDLSPDHDLTENCALTGKVPSTLFFLLLAYHTSGVIIFQVIYFRSIRGSSSHSRQPKNCRPNNPCVLMCVSSFNSVETKECVHMFNRAAWFIGCPEMPLLRESMRCTSCVSTPDCDPHSTVGRVTHEQFPLTRKPETRKYKCILEWCCGWKRLGNYWEEYVGIMRLHIEFWVFKEHSDHLKI